MVTYDSANAHFDYPDVTRHWSPFSGQLAGGDSLVTLFNQGWQLADEIDNEEVWLSGARPVTVCHMTLTRDGEVLKLPVFANPFVRSLLRRRQSDSRPLGDGVTA